MHYKAVIFDLFGTLVDSFTIEAYDDTVKRMAEALGIPYDDFQAVWKKDSHNRNIGVYKTTEEMVAALSGKLGVTVGEERIKAATKVRFDFMRKVMVPRSDALEVLTRLREAGLKTALISNCSPVTEVLWPDTPFPAYFDVTIFSSAVGCRKPDPGIYRRALEELGVEPAECLYVGDGDSNELTGAREAGLNPVMITVPHETSARFDAGKQPWDGPVIASLTEILAMAGVA